ncbi:MAG: T9SS type A sorting domain-containing protein [Bacteroidetes bacterium]|nr:T9SS type A sorting domain-containing protein [Bacteroidota bacterium]
MKIKFVIFLILFQLANIFEMGAQSYWQKNLRTLNPFDHEEFKCIQRLNDGSIVFGGVRHDFTIVPEIIVTRLDSNGIVLFSKGYATSGTSRIFMNASSLMKDSVIYFSCFQLDSINGLRNLGILSLNIDGNFNFFKVYKMPEFHFNTHVYSFTNDSSAILMTGLTQHFDKDSNLGFVLKVDLYGNLQYAAVTDTNVLCTGIISYSDNSCLITATLREEDSLQYYGSCAFIRIDSNFTITQTKIIKANGKYIAPLASTKLKDNGVALTGSYRNLGVNDSEPFILKVDSALNPVFFRYFNIPTQYYGDNIIETNDNGFVVWATLMLIKTDSTGNYQFSKRYINQSGQTQISSLFQDKNDQWHMAGFSGLWGTGDAYYIKTDANYNSGCWQQDYVHTEALVSVYDTNFNFQLYPLQLNTDSLQLAASNIILKDTNWCINYTDIVEKNDVKDMVNPNPFSEIVIIEVQEHSILYIFNLNGQQVLEKEITVGKNILGTDYLPEGGYLFLIRNATGVNYLTYKLIKIK